MAAILVPEQRMIGLANGREVIHSLWLSCRFGGIRGASPQPEAKLPTKKSISSISMVHQLLDIEDVRLTTVSHLVRGTDCNRIRIVRFYGDPVVNAAPTAFADIACQLAEY